MPFQAPRGTHDVLPGEADPNQDADSRLFCTYKWQALERVFRDVCARYRAEEIRTPIFEATSLFHRSVGQSSDIVRKETYDFVDRGKESLTLRPEGTAGVMRAIVEHGLAKAPGSLLRYYYINSHFRYERPQRGRYREHHQVGVEFVGVDSAAVDVEVISLGMNYLRAIGLDDLELQINSVGGPGCRPQYRDALQAHFRPNLERMSEDSQQRFEQNPLRILDSKDPRDQAFIEDAPAMVDYLDDDCASHFAAVCQGLDDQGIAYQLNRRLVRGLDYYQKTAFEVVHHGLGSQNVVLGGGRYDGLLQELGGPAVGGVGFGSGIERALLILETTNRAVGQRLTTQVYLVARSDDERRAAQRLASQLREQGFRVDYDLQGRSQKAQMRAANGSGAPLAVFCRDDLGADVVRLKVMAKVDAGEDAQGLETDVPAAELAAKVAERLQSGAAKGWWSETAARPSV